MPEYVAFIESADGPGAWLLLGLAIFGLILLLHQIAGLLRRLLLKRSPGSLSILLLIHNQEEAIEGLLRELGVMYGRLASEISSLEVLVVDFESTDTTPMILDRLGSELSWLRLVRLPREQAFSPCDSALFLCQNPSILLIDLRYKVQTRGILWLFHEVWK